MQLDSAWSRPVRLTELGRDGVSLTLQPDEAARTRIARLLALVRLSSLRAEVRVAPWLDGAEVNARWSAVVVQTCGISLEDVESELKGDFIVRAVPPSSKLATSGAAEVAIDPHGEDPPDVLENDSLDLGAYLVEQLALAIDPFPRRPGAEFKAPAAESPASPFAILQSLKPDVPRGA